MKDEKEKLYASLLIIVDVRHWGVEEPVGIHWPLYLFSLTLCVVNHFFNTINHFFHLYTKDLPAFILSESSARITHPDTEKKKDHIMCLS